MQLCTVLSKADEERLEGFHCKPPQQVVMSCISDELNKDCEMEKYKQLTKN